MVIRVKVAPDRHGVIRIKCGDTDFEIEVEGYQPPQGTADPPATPGGLPANPGDLPGIYLNVPKRPDGGIDIEALLRDFETRVSDPAKPDPRVVLFRARSADLRDVSRLKQAIERNLGDLPLAIDFGDPGPFDK